MTNGDVDEILTEVGPTRIQAVEFGLGMTLGQTTPLGRLATYDRRLLSLHRREQIPQIGRMASDCLNRIATVSHVVAAFSCLDCIHARNPIDLPKRPSRSSQMPDKSFIAAGHRPENQSAKHFRPELCELLPGTAWTRCESAFRLHASRCAVWLCGENCGLDPFPMSDGCV